MFMNCAGPEGQFNTIGQVLFLGNMLPGPVAPGGKIPKGSFCSTPGMFSNMKDMLGSAQDLVKTGKKLYELANIDWSDPSAVLGSIGGVAGIAGLQDIAGAAKQVKELYDLSDKAINTDWSDPKQVLGTIAGAGNVPGLSDIAKVAQMANKIHDTVNTDWSDPRAAMAAATGIMRSTGLNEMVAAMASNAVLGTDVPVPLSNNAPKLFPQPGGSNSGGGPRGTSSSGSGSNRQQFPPESRDNKEREALTAENVALLEQNNPTAYERYMLLSDEEKKGAFVEFNSPSKDSDGNPYSKGDRAAFYVPGEGFTTTKEERDGLPNVSGIFGDGFKAGLKELFVADKEDATKGNFFGIKQKEGNVYLFGGLIDLGSPEMPGAGNAWSWWVPDRILNMDMSPYYDHHDLEYYGSNLDLSKMGEILRHEVESFKKGATLNPLQLPLQAIYSAGTTLVGALSAVGGEIEAAAGDVKAAGSGTFDSLGDFYNSVFGSDSAASGPSADNLVSNILPHAGGDPMQLPMPTSDGSLGSVGSGGCWGGAGGGGAGGGAGAGGAGAGGSGTVPVTPVAGAPVSGAGTDGILVTTAPGNPTGAAAAIEANFRAANEKEKADAEAKAKAATSKGKTSAAQANKNDKSLPNENENQTHVGNLSLEDAKESSTLAYDATKGEVTPNGKWKVAEVHEDHTGMRAIVLEPTDPNEQRTLVAFAGTDSILDVVNDVEQFIGSVPPQYGHANQLVGELKEKYGDNLVLTGHSLGGGLANYAGGIHGLPGVGINSAPLGLGTRYHINQVNPGGTDQFAHYNNQFDPVSHPASPGEQQGQIFTILGDHGWSGPGFSDHGLENVDPNGTIIAGRPKPPPAPSQSWPDGARRPGEVTYSKPHINNSDPNGPGAIRH